MIHKTKKLLVTGSTGALLLSTLLGGCGGNTATTTDDAVSLASPTPAGRPQPVDIPEELTAFAPGSIFTPKPFPLDAAATQHMSEESGVKFSGNEKEWEVFEISRNGQRTGFAMRTHSDVPGGGDMHIEFAVDQNFKITNTDVTAAPAAAKMKQFVAQAIGKNHKAAFQAGKDLKVPAGLAPQTAQIAADALHKGIIILEENFNPHHAAQEAGGHAGHGH